MRYWGFHTVHAILSSCDRIEGELYVPFSNKRIDALVSLAGAHSVRIHRRKDSAWNTSDTNGRYPLLVTNNAVAPQKTFRTIQQYLSATQHTRECVLLLDGVTDVGNIAAISRSAYNFKVGCIVMSHKTSGDLSLLLRRSAGYYLQMNVVRSANIAQSIKVLKDNHFWIYGASSGGQSLSDVTFNTPKCAIVVGDEHIGLRGSTRTLCDFLVSIPLRPECESLNVSVATGILLYELHRQMGQMAAD